MGCPANLLLEKELEKRLSELFDLVGKNYLTYPECVEILEEELVKRFPLISSQAGQLYQQIHRKSSGPEDYCRKLVELSYSLEKKYSKIV